MADWGLIVTAAATGGLVIFNAAKESQERKRRKRESELVEKYGLKENPTRCAEHTESIGKLQSEIGGLKTNVAVLDTKVCAIQGDITDIKDRLPG
jgi:uncharacterized protein HemX